jgi:hypothetical protein
MDTKSIENISLDTKSPSKTDQRGLSKKYSMKKSISHVNCNRIKKKTDLFFEESFSKDLIQTNLERTISNLNMIKKKLLLIQDIQLAAEIDWMIDTLLKNQLNDVIVKVEKDISNPAELEKMLELLAEFSSEFSLKRDIESLQSTLYQKKQSIGVTDHDLGEIFNFQDKILVKNFDIFTLAQECGRENALLVVSGNLFNYYSLLDRVEKDTFIAFIDEVKIGYKRSNPYHNVKTYITLGPSCRGCCPDCRSYPRSQ